MEIEIAFDIGGTFTDFAVAVNGVIQNRFLKIPTSGANPAIAALQGLSRLKEEMKTGGDQITQLLHASTIATNAILERRGVRTALLTTRGFRDVLLIGRQKRHETFDLHLTKPQPLLSRSDILEIDERVSAAGEVLVVPSDDKVRALARRLRRARVQSVAICFLHAYANPENEQRVASVLAEELPDMDISISSDISPRIREYERTNTTVANAYVRPLVRDYVDNLRQALKKLGVETGLQIMQSNGGLVPADMACSYPIRIIESGPAAGVLMCAAIGRTEGIEHMLTFDMGGTTAKLGAIDNGEAAVSSSFEVDLVDYKRGSGLPLNVPSVELIEIGAGGGSIAEVEAGIIKVGPRSASSQPGPACYGRGGWEPTVTDANLVLGYIDASNFNGKALALDINAARNAIHTQIAEPLGLSVEKAAWAIHTLATNKMERALRNVSIERGRDPRRYAMVAFGGAGPLHAARLARQASIPRVVVPLGAGVGSAIGLLNAPAKLDVSLTRAIILNNDACPTIWKIFDQLTAKLRRQTEQLGQTHDEFVISRHAYMRFRGQGFEINVDLKDGEIDEKFVAHALKRFHDRYHDIYGTVGSKGNVEVIDWYVTGVGARRRSTGFGGNAPGDRVPMIGKRPVYFPETEGFVDCPVYDRYGLKPGVKITGPAVIQESETATILLPGDTAVLSKHGSILIDIEVQP